MNSLPLLGKVFFTTIATLATSVSSLFAPHPTHLIVPVQQSQVVKVSHKQVDTLVKKVLTVAPLSSSAAALLPRNHPVFILPTNTVTGKPQSLPGITSQYTTVTPTSIPLGSGKMMTAKSTITSNGLTLQLTMNYPASGGTIVGSIDGNCTGTITGTYNGPVARTLSGIAKANCSVSVISIPTTITYSGKLDPNATTATIQYTISAAGQTENGETTLQFE